MTMPIELRAATDAGARLVAIAEELSEELAAHAAEHDRNGSYPFEAIDALKAAGYFAAPVPVELGGLGVSSAHDLVVASSRLARGDASVAIGVNMHLVAVLNMERRRRVAVAGGAPRRAQAFAASLERIARDGVVLAAAISERGQDLTRPGTLATRTEAGWRIDGRKTFCTMSPAATDLYVAVTYADDEGTERYAYAMVPIDAPGVVIEDDWDALGMRASGSNSVTLEGVGLPEAGCEAASQRATRCRTWSATWSPGSSTPRPRSASPSRPTPSPVAASRAAATTTRARACRWPTARWTSPRPAASSRARRRSSTTIAPPTRRPTARRRSSTRSSPRRRPPRRSSTRRARGSWTVRSPSPAAPVTSMAARLRAPTAMSRRAPSCTRSVPIAPTTTSPALRSARQTSLH